MGKELTLKGVIPAMILPFRPDDSIDEEGLRRHVSRLAATKGVTGIVCNAGASEVTLLSREERKRVLQIVREEVNGRVLVISGAYGESTETISEAALDAKAGGADAILILPPFSFVWGATQYPEVIYEHFAAIDRAADIPFIVFQYAHWTGCNYDTPTLVQLARIKNFVAIKSAINDPGRYEEQYRALKAARPEISVLNANDVQMLGYFCIGADGALVGYAALTPEPIVELFAAVEKGELKKAREISDRLFPLTRAIYTHPRLNWHTRIKEALVMLGEFESPRARPFLPALSVQEKEAIRAALVSTGLLTNYPSAIGASA
jgi:4-hydroxy-tetrahydrodipicolinate synthase